MDVELPFPVFELSPDEKAMLSARLTKDVPDYRVDSYREFVGKCSEVAKHLPCGLIDWRSKAAAAGIGLIRNLPIDQMLPPTPTVRGVADDIPLLADAVVGVVTGLFGSLYTFGAKTTARHIHNVYPIEADSNTQLGSSKNELEWHVEDGFHPARPDWVILFCLRSDPLAATRLARAADLQLSAALVRRLKEIRFELRIDDSFASSTHTLYVPTAVLSEDTGGPEIVYDPAYTRCDGLGISEDLSAVKAEAERVQISVTLRVGELLVFNNRRAIHARTAYRPRMDGTDRWLKRALAIDRPEWRAKLVDGVMPFAVEQ